MKARRIITSYFRVPGPAPQFDWTAFYDGTEETGPYGSGATAAEAINDLVENSEFGDEAEAVKVEKFPNPLKPRGFDYMAHSGAIGAAGIYGFGATEQEAISEFRKQLESVE